MTNMRLKMRMLKTLCLVCIFLLSLQTLAADIPKMSLDQSWLYSYNRGDFLKEIIQSALWGKKFYELALLQAERGAQEAQRKLDQLNNIEKDLHPNVSQEKLDEYFKIVIESAFSKTAADECSQVLIQYALNAKIYKNTPCKSSFLYRNDLKDKIKILKIYVEFDIYTWNFIKNSLLYLIKTSRNNSATNNSISHNNDVKLINELYDFNMIQFSRLNIDGDQNDFKDYWWSLYEPIMSCMDVLLFKIVNEQGIVNQTIQEIFNRRKFSDNYYFNIFRIANMTMNLSQDSSLKLEDKILGQLQKDFSIDAANRRRMNSFKEKVSTQISSTSDSSRQSRFDVERNLTPQSREISPTFNASRQSIVKTMALQWEKDTAERQRYQTYLSDYHTFNDASLSDYLEQQEAVHKTSSITPQSTSKPPRIKAYKQSSNRNKKTKNTKPKKPNKPIQKNKNHHHCNKSHAPSLPNEIEQDIEDDDVPTGL
jgi:hypothetical protein